jgi:hypothetical protein
MIDENKLVFTPSQLPAKEKRLKNAKFSQDAVARALSTTDAENIQDICKNLEDLISEESFLKLYVLMKIKNKDLDFTYQESSVLPQLVRDHYINRNLRLLKKGKDFLEERKMIWKDYVLKQKLTYQELDELRRRLKNLKDQIYTPLF